MRQQKFRAWDGEQMICPVAMSKSGLAMIEQNPKEGKYRHVTVVEDDGTSIDFYEDWATYQTFKYPLMQLLVVMIKMEKRYLKVIYLLKRF